MASVLLKTAPALMGAGWFHRTVKFVCGVGFCLALAGAGAAESPSRSLAATELLPAGDTNVIATYDGGRVSAGAVAEAGEEPRFVVDAERYAPTNAISRDEKLARHLAALQILVGEARRRGLDQAPEWRLQTKFLEQHLLREALITELLQGVLLSDEEVARYYESNKFRLLTIQAFEARRIGVQTRKHGEQARERAQAGFWGGGAAVFGSGDGGSANKYLSGGFLGERGSPGAGGPGRGTGE
jgi:hypothetical protein